MGFSHESGFLEKVRRKMCCVIFNYKFPGRFNGLHPTQIMSNVNIMGLASRVPLGEHRKLPQI